MPAPIIIHRGGVDFMREIMEKRTRMFATFVHRIDY
jgi:hypothetical protein